MSAAPAYPIFTPAVFYKDPRAALAWLERAFGFETAMLLTDAQGAVAHAEMRYGSGYVSIGSEWAEWTKSPATVEGANTQLLEVQVEGDVDAHCERARAAGARIIAEPQDQFYGARKYRALDLEGHCWVFTQQVREVSLEEMEKASGLTFEKL